jgi:octaprenyl-diphosphate synthase
MQKLAPVNLAAIQRPVRQDLDAVLAELRRIIAADFPIIADVNRHLLRMQGKMLRPTLVLLSASATDDVTPEDVRLAAVVELIHVATLVHDDSVDHSVLRRGQPTVNALFSHQVAVIMGDYLYSRAIIELVKLDDPEPLRVMSRVTNEMTVGEMRELVAHDMLDYSESDYDELIRSKTASLMSAACEIGGLRGRPAEREVLRRYGLLLGMAFQITDDVLDYTGTESVTGKPSGHDLREHKITLPLIAALPRLLPAERRQLQQLMADPAPSDDLIHAVIGAVAAHGGVVAAQERALKLAQRAEAELDLLPESAAREALRDCVSYAVERRS